MGRPDAWTVPVLEKRKSGSSLSRLGAEGRERSGMKLRELCCFKEAGEADADSSLALGMKVGRRAIRQLRHRGMKNSVRKKSSDKQ